MIELHSIDENTIALAKRFLMGVPTIKEIDDDILANAIIAISDGKLIGCLAYESFDNKGLVRYFVFKKMLDDSIIINLFDALEAKAKVNGISELISIVGDNQIEGLFHSLGFSPKNTERLFLDEDIINKTSFKDSKFMHKILL